MKKIIKKIVVFSAALTLLGSPAVFAAEPKQDEGSSATKTQTQDEGSTATKTQTQDEGSTATKKAGSGD